MCLSSILPRSDLAGTRRIWVHGSLKTPEPHLVGGFNHLEKYESQWEGIPYIMEHKKCLKPPIR
jgi:hydroxyacyl-ACP dehydratase HTD2-like protein with hotdog domain